MMRVLVTIPHYFASADRPAPDGRRHGSLRGDPRPRCAALTACIASLHQLYGPAQHVIDLETRVARLANDAGAGHVDVVVCTAGNNHLINQLPLPSVALEHRPVSGDPLALGFACHAVLRDRLGGYDYYGYMEDDLIARDPWMFRKLAWFATQLGPDAVLQPNRYEAGPLGLVHKAYVDGDLPLRTTAPYQTVEGAPAVVCPILGTPVTFSRARNPHAGCFFLNAGQMAHWASRPYFLDGDTGFIGPLESAATLGLMRTFRVYKAAVRCASFLEIEHFGTAFLSQLRRREDATLGPVG